MNFTTKGRKPTTPLLFAAARGYSQTVAKLLDKGADINATFPVDEETQFNALMVAMHSEEITDLPIRQAVCEILIAHGINTLIPRSDGCSPMMCAIDKRMVDVAKLLIEKGITNIDKVAVRISPFSFNPPSSPSFLSSSSFISIMLNYFNYYYYYSIM